MNCLGGVVVEIDYPKCIGTADKIRLYRLYKPDTVIRSGLFICFIIKKVFNTKILSMIVDDVMLLDFWKI